jgi:glucosamine kinase
MPAVLSESFNKKYKIDKESIIRHVYQEPAPNFYLASFAPFLSEHISHPFIIDILKKGFSEFIETNIKSYPDYRLQTCHFVGSIAYHFSDILKELCTANEIKVGKILKHPIEELSRFILKNGI